MLFHRFYNTLKKVKKVFDLPLKLWFNLPKMNDDKAAIQEQILDAAEAVSHLTIRAEQDAERDEQYNRACEGDDYFDYMMDKRFDR